MIEETWKRFERCDMRGVRERKGEGVKQGNYILIKILKRKLVKC